MHSARLAGSNDSPGAGTDNLHVRAPGVACAERARLVPKVYAIGPTRKVSLQEDEMFVIKMGKTVHTSRACPDGYEALRQSRRFPPQYLCAAFVGDFWYEPFRKSRAITGAAVHDGRRFAEQHRDLRAA